MALVKNGMEEERAEETMTEIRSLLHLPVEKFARALENVENLSAVAKEKRFIAALAIGAFLGFVGAVGSALYTSVEVGKMSAIIQEQSRTIRELGFFGEQLAKSVHKWAEKEEEDRFMLIETTLLGSELDAATDELNMFVQAFYAALRHDIDAGLLPPRALKQAEEQIELYANNNHLTPVYPLATEMVSMPNSFIVGSKGLAILIHVPLVEDKDRDIRRLLLLDSAILSSDNDVIELAATHDYIAVNQKEDVHSVHSAADLQGCHKIQDTYLCKDQGLIDKTPASCVGALYYEDTQLAMNNCTLSDVHFHRPAIQINATAFLVDASYSNPTRVTKKCVGRNSENLRLVRPTPVAVEPGCTLFNPQFEAVAARATTTDAITRLHEYQLPGVKLATGEDGETHPLLDDAFGLDLQALDKIVQGYEVAENEGWREELEAFWLKHQVTLVGIAATIILIASLGIIGGLCRRYRCRKRSNGDDDGSDDDRRPPPPTTTPRRPQSDLEAGGAKKRLFAGYNSDVAAEETTDSDVLSSDTSTDSGADTINSPPKQVTIKGDGRTVTYRVTAKEDGSCVVAGPACSGPGEVAEGGQIADPEQGSGDHGAVVAP